MKLNPASFNRFLSGIGQRLVWRKSYACPCITAHSGASDPGCQFCAGKGRTWRAGMSGYAGVSSMSAQRKFSDAGIYEDGDLLLTIPSNTPLYEMGQYDLILMLDGSQPFSSVLERGASDELSFPPVAIDRIFWRVNGVEFSSAATAVDADNKIVWGANAQPPAGVQYSVTGRWIPDYFVFQDLPIVRPHHSGARLPRKVVVRRFDLFGR